MTVIGNHHDLTGLTNGSTVYVRVTAINTGGESFPTEVLGARVGDPRLLIVNGFDKLNGFGLVLEDDPEMGLNERMWVDQMNNFAYTVNHGESVPVTYDHGWDSASNEAITSDAIELSKYAVVDWILGEESNSGDGSLSGSERARIATYLAGGGGLLVSGSELAWDLEAMGRDPEFLHTVLRTDYIADDAATLSAAPVDGGAFDGLDAIAFDAPDEYWVDHPDVLAPLNGGSPALSYIGSSGGTAAVQAVGSGGDGCERLIVMGFPFETIVTSSRPAVMNAALTYLDTCSSLGVQIASPVNEHYYQTPPSFTGIAFGDDLVRVEAQLLRWNDGQYWNGSDWDPADTWLTATGAESWSYPLPPLSDGAYIFRARAAGNSNTSEPTEVSFILDTQRPASPTVITPTGGVSLTTLPIVLEWEAITDDGSPIAYEVELDGKIDATSVVTYRTSLRSGLHQWRVRAYDLAGNTGTWTDIHTFATDYEEVFLPIVLR
jgi:hypothetical protein